MEDSPVGGIAQAQEPPNSCAPEDVLPECEVIRMDEINEAFERMERADVRCRFVIDMASLSGLAGAALGQTLPPGAIG